MFSVAVIWHCCWPLTPVNPIVSAESDEAQAKAAAPIAIRRIDVLAEVLWFNKEIFLRLLRAEKMRASDHKNRGLFGARNDRTEFTLKLPIFRRVVPI
jgi:hypothetical protein